MRCTQTTQRKRLLRRTVTFHSLPAGRDCAARFACCTSARGGWLQTIAAVLPAFIPPSAIFTAGFAN